MSKIPLDNGQYEIRTGRHSDSGELEIEDKQGKVYKFEDGELDLESLGTERLSTRSRQANAVVFEGPNGEYHSVGSDGDAVITSADDVAQVVLDTVATLPNFSTIKFRQPESGSHLMWRQNIEIDKPVSLIGPASFKMADGVNDYFISWNPQLPADNGPDSNADSLIRGLAFWCNNTNNSGVGVLDQLSTSANDLTMADCNIYRHTATAIYIRCFGFTMTNCQTLHGSHRGLRLDSGYNFITSSDISGGVRTKSVEPSFITNCSFFGAGADEAGGTGAHLTSRDQMTNCLVIDNDRDGVLIQATFAPNDSGAARSMVVSNNVIMNNSVSQDNTYSGMTIDGYVSNGSYPHHDAISNNIFWNRDTTLAGSGEGIQKHHIQTIKDTVENIKFSNNVFLDNAGTAATNFAHTNGVNYWDGILGGGPLGGVDLGSTTGSRVGEKALADGTTGTAWLEATWNGSAWVQSDGTTI